MAVAVFTLADYEAMANNLRQPAVADVTLQAKQQLCAQDLDLSNAALRLIAVRPAPRRRTTLPRILCFVNTISVHHETRARAVAETWGQRCDRLVFFSNATDTISVGDGGTSSPRRDFEVIPFDVPADHDHLWLKHRASLRYVYEHYRHDFDWFYKADDDAYVIVDNLRDYLRRPEIMMHHRRQPMQVGHRFNLTAALVDYYIVHDDLRAEWWRRWDRWVFNSGGPGYAMNRLYLDRFVASLQEKFCLGDSMSDMLPDDAAISYCMMWHDVVPWDTRDYRGRERWHADHPQGIYHLDVAKADAYWIAYHAHIGGLRVGPECCAEDSVAFHYVRPAVMYHIERTLHFCRTGDDLATLEDFNRHFGLAIGSRILEAPA